MTKAKQLVSVSQTKASPQPIENQIYNIRGQQVMLDSDLAELYEVPTGRLNEQMARNPLRFPTDFMFQLTQQEYNTLRSQFAISKTGRGGRRFLPYVFTQEGIAMLSSVLNSERAIQVNVAIMRTFVRMRELTAKNDSLTRKLDALEKKYNAKLKHHDIQFKTVFDVIRKMLTPKKQHRSRIGFKT
jgi:hypothetical protein